MERRCQLQDVPYPLHVQGFEFYDTMTTTILSNVTFENYKYKQYSSNPADWWYWQTPHAFRMLSHSDQFKPGEPHPGYTLRQPCAIVAQCWASIARLVANRMSAQTLCDAWVLTYALSRPLHLPH
jgi:hypothetical protein